MSPRPDPARVAAPSVVVEYFSHPTEGYIPFDANTRQFHRLNHQRPISLPEGFPRKQRYIRTCSEPMEGNAGCPKWAGCPFKDYPFVGPGTMIIEKNGVIGASNCFDYYESTGLDGRSSSQVHLGMDGWVPKTDVTSMPVLGRTKALESGKLSVESSREAIAATRPSVWQMEIGNLLPPWWHLMKDKGRPLPAGAKLYPELIDAYRPEEQSSNPSRSPSASRGGRRKRTTKAPE